MKKGRREKYTQRRGRQRAATVAAAAAVVAATLVVAAVPAGAQQPGNNPGPAPTSSNPAPANTGDGGSLPRPGTANDSPSFDIDRTVRAALDSSASVVNARLAAEVSRSRVHEVSAENRPNVTGNASATRFDNKTVIALGDSPPIQVLPDHTEQLGITVGQRIDITGQIRAATNQAKLQALADTFNVRQAEDQRGLQARTIYYTLLRAEHQVSVTESNLRSAQAQQTVAQRLFEGGVGQKIDQLRANTLVAQAQQDLEAARNARDIARANFNDLVGRPLDAPVQLTDVPGATVGVDIQTNPSGNQPPVGAPPANAPAFTPFAPPTAEVDAIDLPGSITNAQNQRPEILTAQALSRASELGIRLARAGNEPSLSISAAGNYYPTTSFQTPRQRVASLTAALTFPFYDGGATKARVDQARLRNDIAKTSLESTRSDVALDVRQAYLNLQTAARQISAANVALDQAVAARQLAQVRYEGQVGLFLEVTDAQAALVRAESAQVDAVYSYLIARARFETALGNAPTAGTNNNSGTNNSTGAGTPPVTPPAAGTAAPPTPPTTTPQQPQQPQRRP